MESAGHSHDTSEHATLFDPQTKELLRNALNAMWSAWRDLSVVEPAASLPAQHTALRYIKEVQQASRIYLQRVGFEPPALDESRRHSGEIADTKVPQVSGEQVSIERDLLRRLLEHLRDGEPIEQEAESALFQLPVLDTDSRLELAKQLRRYQQQPACIDCRNKLAALLYQLLPPVHSQPTLPRNQLETGAFNHWLEQQRGGSR